MISNFPSAFLCLQIEIAFSRLLDVRIKKYNNFWQALVAEIPKLYNISNFIYTNILTVWYHTCYTLPYPLYWRWKQAYRNRLRNVMVWFLQTIFFYVKCHALTKNRKITIYFISADQIFIESRLLEALKSLHIYAMFNIRLCQYQYWSSLSYNLDHICLLYKHRYMNAFL